MAGDVASRCDFPLIGRKLQLCERALPCDHFLSTLMCRLMTLSTSCHTHARSRGIILFYSIHFYSVLRNCFRIFCKTNKKDNDFFWIFLIILLLLNSCALLFRMPNCESFLFLLDKHSLPATPPSRLSAPSTEAALPPFPFSLFGYERVRDMRVRPCMLLEWVCSANRVRTGVMISGCRCEILRISGWSLESSVSS